MPRPPRQDASLAWLGLVASIVVTVTLVRVGVTFNGPITIAPRNSIAVVIRGNGTVEAAAEGVTHTPQNCARSRCVFSFPADAKEVVMTYQPDTGSRFQMWGGACSGNDTWCRIVLGEPKTVIVSFATVADSQ